MHRHKRPAGTNPSINHLLLIGTHHLIDKEVIIYSKAVFVRKPACEMTIKAGNWIWISDESEEFMQETQHIQQTTTDANVLIFITYTQAFSIHSIRTNTLVLAKTFLTRKLPYPEQRDIDKRLPRTRMDSGVN